MPFAADDTPPNPADALFEAAARGDIAALRQGIKTLDINGADAHGWTPLIWAVSANEIPAVIFLLAEGAAVDQQATGGWSALHYAADSRNAPMVDVLLAHKANAFLPADNNETPAELARRSGDEKLARHIESQNQNPGMVLTRNLTVRAKPLKWKS